MYKNFKLKKKSKIYNLTNVSAQEPDNSVLACFSLITF